MSWTDGSAVKTAYWCFRGPKFGTQQPYGSSQSPVKLVETTCEIPDPGAIAPSFDLCLLLN